MMFALAAAIAVVAGGLLVWNGSPNGQADVALIDAVQKQTGLLLSAEHAALDPTTGVWRASLLELRTSKDAEPVLRAKDVELKLRVAELLRGDVRIERAVLGVTTLLLDLRERPAGEAAEPIDRARLTPWFPAEAEIASATMVIKTERRDLEISGLALTLKRDGDTLRGPLTNKSSHARFVVPGQTEQAAPWPISIEAQAAWSKGGVALDGVALVIGSSTLRGAANVGESARLDLTGDEVEIQDFGPLLSPELAGRGRIELHAKSGKGAFGVTAKLDLRKAAARELAVDRIQALASFTEAAVVLREVAIERSDERYHANELRLGATLQPEGKLHIENVQLAGVLAHAGLSLAATGRASGDVDLSEGATSVALELSAPALGAYRFDSGKLDASFIASGEGAAALEISQLELRSKVATVIVSGKAEASGKLALTGKARATLGGRDLDVAIEVRGTAQKPETTLELAGVDAARAGYALRAELSGTQLVRGHVELTDADFSTQLPAIENAGAPYGKIDARLELTRGSLDDLRAFEGQGEVTQLSFGYGDIRFANSDAFPISLRDGRVQLRDVELEADDTLWSLSGELDVERGADLKATSEVPLQPLLEAAPFVEAADGTLRVSLAIRGSAAELALTGEAVPRDVALALGPLKTPWSNVQGRVSLEGGALRFHDVTGSFGTGTLTMSGALALAGSKPKSADLKLALRNFAFSPQQRFDIALDADNTLKWTAGDALPVLGGHVTLARMHYGRHVQLPEAVLALGKKSKPASDPTVAVDLLVGHSAPLTVRNDFLDVELEATGKTKAVRVTGTDVQLGAVGELSITRGRALFRGATLTVRRGLITFKSESSVVPALDLLADAPAKRRPGGLIHFTANGDPSRFDLELHCEASGAVPPPFACTYAGTEMICGNFTELTALWACQAP